MNCEECAGQGVFIIRTPNKVTAERCRECSGTGEKPPPVRPTVRRSPVLPGPQQEEALLQDIPDQKGFRAGFCHGAISALKDLAHEVARGMSDTP